MTAKTETAAEVLAEMRNSAWPYAENWADRLERALSAQGEAVASDEVLIAIKRGEGYEDVHPHLVAEDALRQTLHGWCQFAWRVVTHPAPARVTEERIAKLEAEILALRVAAQPFVRYNSSEKTTSIRVNSEDIKALRFALSNAPAISVTEDIVERFCAATFVGWAKMPEEKKSIFREKERVSLTAALEADHG